MPTATCAPLRSRRRKRSRSTSRAPPSSRDCATTRSRGLYIDNAAQSRFDRHWIIPMGRRLETSSGEFAGVVAAHGRIDYFQQFYRDIRLDEGTKVTLMQQSGTLLARHPPVESALGKRFALFDEMLASRKAGEPGPMRTMSPVDGVERFGASQMVPGYPLAVIVTRDTATALAPWREQAAGTAIRTLALSVLAALLLAIVMRQFARLNAARQSLEVSQERYALAMIGSNEGHWDWDTVKDELFTSATMKTLFGLPPDAQVSTWSAFFERIAPHADDLRAVRMAFDDHLSGRSPRLDLEHRVVHRDTGDVRWVHSRGQCFRSDDGKPVRIAGSTVDITGRKRTEEALRQSQERYALAVAGSDDGVWDWDFSAGVAFESARAQRAARLAAGAGAAAVERSGRIAARASGRCAAARRRHTRAPRRADAGLRVRVPRAPRRRQLPMGARACTVHSRRRGQAMPHGRLGERHRRARARRAGAAPVRRALQARGGRLQRRAVGLGPAARHAVPFATRADADGPAAQRAAAAATRMDRSLDLSPRRHRSRARRDLGALERRHAAFRGGVPHALCRRRVALVSPTRHRGA